MVLAVPAVVALIAAGTMLVYGTGGTRWPWLHVLYLPVLLAAFRFGIRGAILTAVAAGLAVGPAMPLDVGAGTAQEPAGWIFRAGLFIVVAAAAGTAHDIARRRLDALAASESRLDALLRNASDLVVVHEDDGTVRFAAPAVRRVLGYEPDHLVGVDLAELMHPNDRLCAPGESFELRLRHADGSWRHLHALTTDLRRDTAVAGFVLNAQDVTERRAVEAELVHQAQHDPLTGLLNHVEFVRRLADALRQEDGLGRGLAVIVVDVDRFSTVNDVYGHGEGDRVIVALGQRLHEDGDAARLAARFGGSELVVLDEGVTAEGALAAAERARGIVDEPFTLGGSDIQLTASAGLARPTSATDPESLVSDAFTALRAAKRAGGDRSVVFRAGMGEQAAPYLRTNGALQRALRAGELHAYYQPIVHLPTARAISFEALARWRHPTAGVVPPTEFIPAAEQSGLIGLLGSWILREACERLASWRDDHPSTIDLTVSVNLSPRQLEDPELVDTIDHALRVSGVPASRLTLELTETSVIAETQTSIDRLDELKDLGVRIAIDDFGTGYSSLRYLRRLPIDALKIDRMFIRELGTASKDDVIVSAVVGLARSLGLQTIAEGVETPEQAHGLLELGCDLQQGYLYHRPAPPEQIDIDGVLRHHHFARPG